MNLADILFPKSCLGCGRSGGYICENCLSKVRTPKPVCPECLKPSIDGMTHTKCLRPLGLDGLISLWNYEGVVRKAILALKYKYAEEIAQELSQYAVEALETRNSFCLIPASPAGRYTSISLVPIPLYWLRKNWRGFNQAEEIGKTISGGVGWKHEPNLLIRKKLKVPQTSLKRRERLSNVQGIFAVSLNIDISQYPNIVLFDDVWTTGSTLKEVAKVLKRAGVKKVWGVTLARGFSW